MPTNNHSIMQLWNFNVFLSMCPFTRLLCYGINNKDLLQTDNKENSNEMYKGRGENTFSKMKNSKDIIKYSMQMKFEETYT